MKSAATETQRPFPPNPGLNLSALEPLQIANIALKLVSTGAGERSLLYSMVQSYNSLLSEVLNLHPGGGSF